MAAQLYSHWTRLTLSFLSVLWISAASGSEAEQDLVDPQFKNWTLQKILETLNEPGREKERMQLRCLSPDELASMGSGLLSIVPNCHCVFEYIGFPAHERFYEQTLRFLANFRVPLEKLQVMGADSNRAKFKINMMCEVYWTMGTLSQEMVQTLDTLDAFYALRFSRFSIAHYREQMSYFAQLQLGMMYGTHRLLMSRPLRYGALGLSLCFIGYQGVLKPLGLV